MILAAQEHASKTNSIKYSIYRSQRHNFVNCVKNPLRQYGVLSVDSRNLLRIDVINATKRWPGGYTWRAQEIWDRVYS